MLKYFVYTLYCFSFFNLYYQQEFQFFDLDEIQLNANQYQEDRSEIDQSRRVHLEKFFDKLILDSNITDHNPDDSSSRGYHSNVRTYNSLIANNDPPKPFQKCERIYQRKEFHDLTPEELQRYVNAINELHKRPSVRRPGHSAYAEFTMIHVESADEGHTTAQFFPWHRALIYEFEQALQDIDPEITLPYWDWGQDAFDAEKSDVLAYYGGSYPNGDKSAGCIKGGPFGHWEHKYPYKHCISRGANLTMPNPTRWMSNDELGVFIATTPTYARFEFEFEVDSHSLVHYWLAGSDDDDLFNIGDMFYMHSPNDPIFWLHHANVDRIFHLWQETHDTNRTGYFGSGRFIKKLYGSDIMIPWDYDVKSVLDIRNLCYEYLPPIKKAQKSLDNALIQRSKAGKNQTQIPNMSNATVIPPQSNSTTQTAVPLSRRSQPNSTQDEIVQKVLDHKKRDNQDEKQLKESDKIIKLNCTLLKKYFNTEPGKELKLDLDELLGLEGVFGDINISDNPDKKPQDGQSQTLSNQEKELIVPSINYLKAMGIKVEEFNLARERSKIISNLIKKLKSLGYTIPSMENICMN